MPARKATAAAPKAATAATKKTATTKAVAKTTTKAAATKKEAPKPLTNGTANKKRKAEDEGDVETKSKKTKAEEPVAPKPKKVAAPKRATTPAAAKSTHIPIGNAINDVPAEIYDIYVFGEGSSGELGLGSKKVDGKKPVDVKRPRLNANLLAATVGVVQIACGGMHAAALTKDNKILTWGVNDQGALGRDTTWDGGLVDMDNAGESSDSEDDDEDSGVNPSESTPAVVSDEHFAPGTKFVQVVASDSATFVLTTDGRVYGWGTFRSSDGILGFTENIKIRTRPMLLPTLKNIKSLAAGSNHILALDHKGNVVAWGCGQQNQLARRIIERNKLSSLIPQGVGLPRGKIVKIACGSYHSFAIDKDGRVWGWGLNNFGEIGVEANAGEDDAVILKPAKLANLEDEKIVDVDGGEHHSVACSEKGKLYTWGRVDGYQVGFEFDALNRENSIYDERGNARILFKPTVHSCKSSSLSSRPITYTNTLVTVDDIRSVAAGTDNSFALTKDGKVYSWGFSSNYQTGQGTIDDIKVPTLIDNTAIRGKQIVVAGAGGQFSVLAGKADVPKVNGA